MSDSSETERSETAFNNSGDLFASSPEVDSGADLFDSPPVNGQIFIKTFSTCLISVIMVMKIISTNIIGYDYVQIIALWVSQRYVIGCEIIMYITAKEKHRI